MNAQVRKRRDGTLLPRRYRALQLPVIVWLTAVWVALWGDISVANVLGGLAVGVIVTLAFPLPPLRMDLQIHPVRLVALAVRFVADVVRASIQVARLTLQFGRVPRNAVIEVNLRTHSDFILTLTAEMATLVPGSIVVEARRLNHTLFLHILDVGDAAGVERARSSVLDLERRIVLAVGSEADQAALDGGVL